MFYSVNHSCSASLLHLGVLLHEQLVVGRCLRLVRWRRPLLEHVFIQDRRSLLSGFRLVPVRSVFFVAYTAAATCAYFVPEKHL